MKISLENLSCSFLQMRKRRGYSAKGLCDSCLWKGDARISKNGQGVFVQTATNATVESVNEGIVVFAGKKEELGNTVQIQHADGTESWYANLNDMSVKLYDYVSKKQKIGIVSNDENNKNGKFYFAIKKNEKFIDPIQVISFD